MTTTTTIIILYSRVRVVMTMYSNQFMKQPTPTHAPIHYLPDTPQTPSYLLESMGSEQIQVEHKHYLPDARPYLLGSTGAKSKIILV